MTAEPCALLAIGALGALSDLGTAVLARADRRRDPGRDHRLVERRCE